MTALHPPGDLIEGERFSGDAVVAGRISGPQPRLRVRRGQASGERRVLEPLLQQPHGPPVESHALCGGTALEIIEQDGGITGPVQIAHAQRLDAVRDDPDIGAQQQAIRQRDVAVDEQRRNHSGQNATHR